MIELQINEHLRGDLSSLKFPRLKRLLLFGEHTWLPIDLPPDLAHFEYSGDDIHETLLKTIPVVCPHISSIDLHISHGWDIIDVRVIPRIISCFSGCPVLRSISLSCRFRGEEMRKLFLCMGSLGCLQELKVPQILGFSGFSSILTTISDTWQSWR